MYLFVFFGDLLVFFAEEVVHKGLAKDAGLLAYDGGVFAGNTARTGYVSIGRIHIAAASRPTRRGKR